MNYSFYLSFDTCTKKKRHIVHLKLSIVTHRQICRPSLSLSRERTDEIIHTFVALPQFFFLFSFFSHNKHAHISKQKKKATIEAPLVSNNYKTWYNKTKKSKLNIFDYFSLYLIVIHQHL